MWHYGTHGTIYLLLLLKKKEYCGTNGTSGSNYYCYIFRGK
jgi:hypothetical protein